MLSDNAPFFAIASFEFWCQSYTVIIEHTYDVRRNPRFHEKIAAPQLPKERRASDSSLGWISNIVKEKR